MPPTMPASRTRNWTSELVRSLTVSAIGSMSNLKNMPGTPLPCSVVRLISVTEYWFVCKRRRAALTYVVDTTERKYWKM